MSNSDAELTPLDPACESESKKKERTQAKRNFTRQVNNVRKSLENKVLRETAKNRFQDLKAAWSELQKRHDLFLLTLTDEEQEAEENWIIEPNELYNDLEEKTDRYIEALEAENITAKDHERFKEKSIILASQRETETARISESVRRMTIMLAEAQINDTEEKAIMIEELAKAMSYEINAYDTAQREYMFLLKDVEEIARETRQLVNIREQYNEVHTKSQIFLKTRTKAESLSSGGVRLERLKFQPFNGDLRKYPKFKSDFIRFILPAYRSDQLSFVLKSYLEDHIKPEVEALEELEEIWDRLDKKYGDEGKHVDAIMADIKAMPKCTEGDVKEILNLINTIEKAHRDLVNLGREQEINNATIVSMIEERLPNELENEWIKKVTGEDRETICKNKFPTLLKLLLQFRERMEYKHANIRSNESVAGNVNLALNTERKPTTKPKCWLHQVNGDHPIWRCRLYQSKSAEEKVELARNHNACFACLEVGHQANSCKRNFKCRQEGCSLPHHDLLHEAHVSGIVFHNASSRTKSKAILQIQTVECYNNATGHQEVNVLWDGAGTISLITFETAERLKLKGKKVHLEIKKVGGTKSITESYKYEITLIDSQKKAVAVEVLGIDVISDYIIEVSTLDTSRIFGINSEMLSRPKAGGKIDCLIGLDYAAFHPVRVKAVGHLLMLKNRFGLVLGGVGNQQISKEEAVGNIESAQVYNMQGHFKEFFSIESLGVQCSPKCGSCKCGNCHPGGKDMTLKEEREYRLIDENLVYQKEEKRWEATYPWIRDPYELPNNKSAVQAKLQTTEKRLMKNQELADQYSRQIHDMVNRGASRKVEEEELRNYTGPVHYISHHAVLKPESESTPCRIVFNSSANFQGHVLNEYYAKGPDMLNTLLGVLIRFREREVAVIGDISKMFHAIKISPQDQMTHLYLWRDLDTQKEPETYAMTAVNMGDKPSATIAIAALKKTAQMQQEKFPEACRAITENSYMDDIVDGAPTVKEAIQRTKEIDMVLAEGGFKIKKWTVSGVQQQQMPTTSSALNANQSEAERVLGMVWKNESDILIFDINKQGQRLKELQAGSQPSSLTKRGVLSVINGIYDPLGLISPYTVQAKIMMRKLWAGAASISWDDPLPREMEDEWNTFFQILPEIQDISFPRSVKPQGAVGDPTLIVFSDASGEAYGAVAYVRWLLNDGSYDCRIIAAKSRIAPLKTVNIVRLELLGAVLSKRIRCLIEKETNHKFENVYHIVDSEIVKAMISKESYGFNTFAANRIGEIQQATNPSEWYWVQGALNIADWVTRGKKPSSLCMGSAWQVGPSFLRLQEKEWPIQCSTSIEELPERLRFPLIATVDGNVTESLADRIDIDRFSSLPLLVNTTARVLRLYDRFRSTNREGHIGKGELTVNERSIAEKFWIQDAQIIFKDDYQDTRYKKLCPRSKDGLIVVGGRAERWLEATWNKQEFLLLPKDHRLSYLIAIFEHKASGHYGVAATISRIRLKYWIIGVRSLVKRIVSQCVICKRKRKELSSQIMASLPIERLKPSPPFSNTSLDFFGPFTIRGEVQKRIRGKCYGVIFTCMVSRAVYVDLSHDYSTDAFLQVLRKFACVRGWPRTIYSDPGSQLVCASKELKDAIKGLDLAALQQHSILYDTEWRFSPADGPWFNGVTEALVKSVKRVLCSCIGEQVMKFSELQTVMFEAAQILNQRPIGSHPTTPEDYTYLCPNDLLLGRASNKIPQGPFKERCSNKNRLDFIQSIVNSFWKKWSQGVFPNMVMRPKWHVARRNVKVGDVVLIQDSNAIRDEWKIGLVSQAFEGEDGRVRRVMVSYKNFEGNPREYRNVDSRTVERPVQKLIVLVPAGNDHNPN